MGVELLTGDCRQILKTLPEKKINCCVTSPPYWGLRDYDVDGQLGLEPTPKEYVEKIVEVFRGVHRVLRDDGTLWLNIGDSYSHGGAGSRDQERWPKQSRNDHVVSHSKTKTGLKPKDLVGIPWMLAFALRSDGWYLRQDIIWSKPNPMPESVKDRCTKSHEYIFLLSKSKKYYYDNDSIREPMVYGLTKNGVGFGHGTDKKTRNRDRIKTNKSVNKKDYQGRTDGISRPPMNTKHRDYNPLGRNKRAVWEIEDHNQLKEWLEINHPELLAEFMCNSKHSVWDISTTPFKDAHFATFPPKLIEPCILAGCPEGGTVLDPFGGSGTTGEVAIKHRRNAILIELNPEYIELQKKRTSNVQQRLV